MINPIIKIGERGNMVITDNDEILADTLSSLARNNTFCPNISRVIFNLGKDKETKEYTLATTVYFVDGTKVTVKNVKNDIVTVTKEKVRLSDGTEEEVETASRESREMGLVYALAKRMIGKPDSNGQIANNGFVNFLNKQIDKSYNQNIEQFRTARENEIRKARLSKGAKKNATVKKEEPSLRKCVQSLTDLLAKMEKKYR